MSPFKFIPLLALLLVTACNRSPQDAADTQSLMNGSAAAYIAGNYVNAQRLAAEATRRDTQFAEAWVGYGMASVRLGQTTLARATYQQALALYQARHRQYPALTTPVIQEIFLLTILNRPADAEALLKQAHMEYPKDPTITKFASDFAGMERGFNTLQVTVP
jgi:Flp pilus assembly protein TadD